MSIHVATSVRLWQLAIGALVVLQACSDSGTEPSSPAALVAGGGDTQTGTVGAALATPLLVRVSDQRGQPMSGVPVTWSVTAGGGSLSPASTTTTASGEATSTWMLGTSVEQNTATATVAGLSPVTFTATGEAGPVTQLILSPDSVMLQAGETQRFAAEASDQFGNVVTPEIRWSSSDTAVARVDQEGLANTRKARAATITATADGASATAKVFVMPGKPAELSRRAGDGQTARAATAVSDSLVVMVTDAFENGVAGVAVTWTVEQGAGSISPTTSSSDSSGTVRAAWIMGRHAGTYTVVAASSIIQEGSTPFTATATPNGTISGSVSVTGDLTGFSAALAPTGDQWRRPGKAGAALGQASGASTSAARPSSRRGQGEPSATRLIVTYSPASVGVGAAAMAGASPAALRQVSREIHSLLETPSRGEDFAVRGISPAILAARIEVADPTRVDDVRATLRADHRVDSVEREQWYHATGDVITTTDRGRVVPSDPLYPVVAWNYGLIDLPRAWNLTTGSSEVVVGVIDSGIRFDHPDISGNLTSDGYDFVSQSTSSVCGVVRDNAGDGDGYDSDPTEPMDYDCSTGGGSTAGSHGLHVAGTIGASGDNGLGASGVNWRVRIRPVRALGVTGSGSTYDIAQAILYAAGLPADDGAGGTVQAPSRSQIVNMSLGGGYAAVVDNAIRAAAGAGVLLIAAAGNESSSIPSYPAALPEVISVSAVSAYSALAEYSNYGPTIDIAAPGGNSADGDASFMIASTTWDFSINQAGYWYMQGTSMAAPHVSGVAALLLSQEPSLTAPQLRARLLDYAVDIGPLGRDDSFGAGLLNARNSLTRSRAPRRALRARLYDATGAIVAAVDAAGADYAFDELPDGNYHVFAGYDEEGDGLIGVPGRIFGAFTSAGRMTPVYVDGAGVYPASFSAGFPSETEPNDAAAAANRLVIDGYAHGFFGTGSDVDVYEITVPAGRYTFETSGWNGTACGFAYGADTVLELRRDDGTLIAANDDAPGALNYCSSITATLSEGTYRVHVSPYVSGGSAYRIEVRRDP